MSEYQSLWNDTKDQLNDMMDEANFQDTFGEVKYVAKEENGIIYVITPSPFIKNKINSIYSRTISEVLSKLTSRKLKFKFVCEDELNSRTVKQQPAFPVINKHNLNENYNFESFVVGESNRMSYLTATKVAENPGTTFNPLYIFGGVGLGKTHLMQAIGNYIADSDVNNKILYVQANEYLEDYGRAIRDNNMRAFEEKYENLDVLLVDDIQMLEKGKSSQQEFFKLFNNMTDRQKQIVITSDTPPAKLNGIMERLTSRFQMGLTVDIKQPDYNQRVQILKRKLLETSQVQVSEDVIKYIAENFVNNVRELEGALTRVLWQAEILNTTPNIQIAKDTLEILINAQIKDDKTNYENALSVIADFYTISVADLLGKSRESKYTLPRHIAMYLLKNHYNLTYSKIGAIFNGRDHTTVMNGCTKIDGELNTDKELKMAVDSILKKI